MKNAYLADIQDFLIEIAERDPQKIINLYTGDDMHLRLLLIDAIAKRSIIIKNKLYTYADNVVMGASEDAVLTWMKQPNNAKVLELVKKDTHPEVYNITNPETEKIVKDIQEAKQTKATTK